jgi:uncharacterized protein (TIGR00290 family)
MGRKRVAFHWSGGKDSAHAVHRLLADESFELACLVTNVYGPNSLSTVHAVPELLLRAQADALGVPLVTVKLESPELQDYEAAMRACATRMRAEGIDAFGFGDLDHSGTRHHRIALCDSAGLELVTPLEGLTATECADAYLASGIQGVVVVVNAAVLGEDALGATIDREFVAGLPAGCDPCGEFGEFHSFAWSSPDYRVPIDFVRHSVEHVQHTIGTESGPTEFAYWRLNLR